MKAKNLFIRLFLFAILIASSAYAAEGKSSKKAAACEQALPESAVAETSTDFSSLVRPKFTLEYLQTHRHELTAKNPKYVLGETGAAIWYVENRVLKSSQEEKIVAVKYIKDFDPTYESEIDQTARSLVLQHEVFKKLGLLEYFEVMLPLEVGPDYLVIDLVIGESLNSLTLRELAPLGPPAKYADPNVFRLGPPAPQQHPLLAQLWAGEQAGLRKLKSELKKAGYKISEAHNSTSWSGVKYIFDFFVEGSDYSQSFRIRNDFIVTTDGRFVMVDPD